jgi:hypothetical protein
VGQVHRKLAALRPTYEITLGGKDVAEVRRHLFTLSANGSPSTFPAPATWRSAATCSATNSRSTGTARRSRRSSIPEVPRVTSGASKARASSAGTRRQDRCFGAATSKAGAVPPRPRDRASQRPAAGTGHSAPDVLRQEPSDD